MKIIKNNIVNVILIVVSFVFNIAVFAPIEIYYTNKNEFWFKTKDILPIIIPFGVIMLIILMLIMLCLKKGRNIALKILFALNICLYIQGNFLNFGYAPLDGTKIEWNTMIYKGIANSLIWILIIILPYGIKKLKKEENFKLFTSIISLFIILIEVITLLAVILGQPEKRRIMNGLSSQNIFNLSKKNNIVVFMSDTFEGTYMNKILEDYPEYKEKLQDFTYFDNCTGVSFFTYSSMPTLLTGEECQVKNTLRENLEYCFNNTNLYKVLKENNYSTELYTEASLVPKNYIIDNLGNYKLITSLETKTKLTKKIYEYTLYRYLPHFLKSKFTVNNNEFYSLKSSDKTLSYKEKTYSLDDVVFNRELLSSGIITKSKQNTFKFYQTDGMHTPYNTTENLEYDESEEYKKLPDQKKRYNEAKASLNLLYNYINELKESKIYDNTTIIFLADHGYENRFYTTLLVKKAEDNHDFEISSAPVSLLKDLVPTILNIATKTKDYGKDFFDYYENEERKRQVYDFTYEVEILGYNEYKTISRIVFETMGLAKDKDSFYIIKEEYENENKQLDEKYNFGDIIKIDDINNLKTVNLTGFALQKVNINFPLGCNISKNTYLEVNRNLTNRDIIANFKIKKVYDDKQIINLKVNGETIYSCKVSNNEKDISFKIPKEIWNSNEKLIIEMEFPDAELGKYYATAMIAICLESFSFNNTK